MRQMQEYPLDIVRRLVDSSAEEYIPRCHLVKLLEHAIRNRDMQNFAHNIPCRDEFDKLPRRLTQVCNLYLDGQTAASIAKALQISKATAGNYIGNLFRKMEMIEMPEKCHLGNLVWMTLMAVDRGHIQID